MSQKGGEIRRPIALDRVRRSDPDRRRFSLVRDLLLGDSPAAAALGIDLSLHHLGLVACGERGGECARGLASALARPLFVVGADDGAQWGWLSGTRPLDAEEERELARFRPAQPGRIALGLAARGEAGFRATHRQAQRARWVARDLGRPMVLYAEVAIEALAGVSDEDARAFVAHELRGIDDGSPSSLRLRETIAAYFAAEHNAVASAASLRVHPQTVARRLRVAEALLGGPVASRRAELETALRLRRCLRSGSLDPPRQRGVPAA